MKRILLLLCIAPLTALLLAACTESEMPENAVASQVKSSVFAGESAPAFESTAMPEELPGQETNAFETTSPSVESNSSEEPTGNAPDASVSPPPTKKDVTAPITEAPKTTATTAPASPYVRPFDLDGIKNDLIAYAKQIGLEYITHVPMEIGEPLGGLELTLDALAWEPPYNTALYKSESGFRKQMHEQLDYLVGRGMSYFGLIIEPNNRAGEYTIYILYC